MRPCLHRFWAISIFATLMSAQPAVARTFTSADGTRKIEAEVVSFDPDRQVVTLKGPDGRITKADLSAFSASDREFLKRQHATKPDTPDESSGIEFSERLVKELEDLARKSNRATSEEVVQKQTKLLLKLLNGNSHHALRRYAARAAGSVPSSELIPPLINLLDDRIARTDAHHSLIRLSGKYIAPERGDWAKWWEENGEGFLPVCLTQRKLADVLEDNVPDTGEPDPTRPTFYGRELEGENILFLLDISGSMEGPRIMRLKMELSSMIEKLPETCRFGFIYFPHPEERRKRSEVEKEQYHLELATDDAKREALKGVSELEAGGATPMRTALEAAFDAADAGQVIDTMYILSDGEPTDASAGRVIRLVSNRNQGHYMAIHTVAIGSASGFLKAIADEHDGFYTWSATAR